MVLCDLFLVYLENCMKWSEGHGINPRPFVTVYFLYNLVEISKISTLETEIYLVWTWLDFPQELVTII